MIDNNNKKVIQKLKETRLRTITKVILLRIIVFILIAIFVKILIGGSWTDGISLALLDVGIELVTHYIYDRVWQNISWGIIVKEPDDPNKTYKIIEVNLESIVEEGKEEEEKDKE